MAGQFFPIFSIYGTESSEELLLRECQDLLTNQESKNLYSRKKKNLYETAISHLLYNIDKIQLNPCKQSLRHKNKTNDAFAQKEQLLREKMKSIYLTFTFQRTAKSSHFGKDSHVNNHQLN